MRRREILGVCAAAATWPLALRAQQPALPVIGFLSSVSPGPFAHFVAAFRAGLGETGYIDGQNVTIEYLWAEGQYDRLPKMAGEFVKRQVAVLVATGGIPVVHASKAATATIPIVFITGGDPVKENIVASLNRPGANLTGVTFIQGSLGAKKLDLLRAVAPNSTTIAVLVNPENPTSDSERGDVLVAARVLGRKSVVVNASNANELDQAFDSLLKQGADALLVSTDPLFLARRDQIVALASRYRIPTMYAQRDFVTAGGLISYGTSILDSYRQVGVYTGRILRGTKPADLPVLQPTKFELIVNLKTAKSLDLKISESFLTLADEVIE